MQSDYQVVWRWGEEGLTLDEERTVDPPYPGCAHNCNHLFFPNGDAGGLRECPLRRDDRVDKEVKTYMRSTSKRSAAARAR